MKPTHLLIIPVLAGGCAELADVEPDDIAVDVCPDDSCARIADGTSALPVVVRAIVPEPHLDLKVRLRLSAGAFKDPSDSSRAAETELALARGDQAIATMIAPLVAGPLRIDAELGGRTVSTTFAFAAAAVHAVELAATPSRLGDAMPIALAVAARAERGKLSTGTTATLRIVDRDPTTAYAQLFPSSGVLDAAGGLGAALHKDAALRTITIEAAVVPPAVDGLAAAVPVTQRLTLSAP